MASSSLSLKLESELLFDFRDAFSSSDIDWPPAFGE
jgi:hypothetical protein